MISTIDPQDIYRRRINTAIDYIETHLHSKLDVASISNEACFSPFHFQRIFSAHMGESLYAFVTRLRVEKAATMLHTRQISITEAAHTVGFEDSATFARAFKKRYGTSASNWLKRKKSRIHQARTTATTYTKISMNHQSETVQAETERLLELPERSLVYQRHIGPYAGNHRLFLRLHRNLMCALNETAVQWQPEEGCIVVYHDSLESSKSERLRISMGVIADADTVPKTNQSLVSMQLPAGRYLTCRFSLQQDDYSKAWTEVFRNILPSQNLEPADAHSYEQYPENCYDARTGRTQLYICVPVIKLKERHYND